MVFYMRYFFTMLQVLQKKQNHIVLIWLMQFMFCNLVANIET